MTQQNKVKLGIIGAMTVEVELLAERMDITSTLERSVTTFYEGTLNGCDVVVAKCGVGKVNAAACTQSMIDLFGVTHLVNTGVAGSLAEELGIGDLLVSLDVVHHDVDVTALGYEPHQLPDFSEVFFTADPLMCENLERACETVAPQANCLRGRVASGDQFVSGVEQRSRIRGALGASCAEMEGAAIAQVATVNDVPFVILRAISDHADGSACDDYPAFERSSATIAAQVMEEFAGLMAD
jgi:adenosylhomocysteine nucleosidase